ncbi:MAG: HlyD family secretion protein [Sulfurimonas sp.]|nr:MAG: HlyD family secretion protein [Sulfurimonas sp.]
MKILLALILVISISFAKVYYAKVEPFEVRNISSNVSGLVMYANEDLIGTRLSSKPYIRIDDKLDIKELQYIEDKLEYLRKIVDVNNKVLDNLSRSLEKKRQNYSKVVALKFKSSVEKDKEYYDLIANENSNLNTQKEIENLKVQITDLKLRRAYLQRSIDDKRLIADGFVLYNLLVKPGQVVGISTPLAKVADVSKAKLTIYLDEADVVNVKKKLVYIDGKKTSYKVSRVLSIADSINISKYMAQIIMPSPKLFSKLVKVELVKEQISE